MILFIALLGCSVKGTVELVQAERAYQLGQQQNLRDKDIFSWTMANSYLKKAREEYANSNYEQASILAERSTEWLNKITPDEPPSESDSTDNPDSENSGSPAQESDSDESTDSKTKEAIPSDPNPPTEDKE